MSGTKIETETETETETEIATCKSHHDIEVAVVIGVMAPHPHPPRMLSRSTAVEAATPIAIVAIVGAVGPRHLPTLVVAIAR